MSEKRDCSVACRLTRGEREALDQLASAEWINLSEAIRLALVEKCEQHGIIIEEPEPALAWPE